MIKPYYEESGITIYHGDCRDILPSLHKVDLVLTDPPYGIQGATGNNATHKKGIYSGAFPDTPEYIENVVAPIIKQCLKQTKRLIITPGNQNIYLLPKPDDIGSFFMSASASFSRWGIITTHLILYYGRDPRAGSVGLSPNGKYLVEAAEKNGHPCAKPFKAWQWLLAKGSLEGETVLDPFMGSGTTLRAAKDLGRKAIGIEIEEKYCEIAVRRLRQEVLDFGPLK